MVEMMSMILAPEGLSRSICVTDNTRLTVLMQAAIIPGGGIVSFESAYGGI